MPFKLITATFIKTKPMSKQGNVILVLFFSISRATF